jgi:HPt (histidine-containing phosphotransfer) domain-containing protein
MFEDIEDNAIANMFDLLHNYPELMNLQTLDVAMFQELRETIGDDLIFSDLVTIYLNSAENLMVSIQDAITNQDAGKLVISSHSLKSTSASIGATRLSQISKYLEKVGRTGATSVSSEVLNLLNNEYTEVITAIKTCILEFMSE